jgi:ferredoxin
MGILNVLLHNSSQASRTRQPADNVAYPAGFRGALNHQTELCVGCTTCQYVCSPGAIRFLDQTIDGVTWGYISAQCTFCGKCVEYCPTKALSFEQNPPALAKTVLAKLHKIEYHPCPKCSQLFAPLPVPTIERLCGGYAPETMINLMKLCEKCRNRAAVETFKQSLHGELHAVGGGQ